MHFLNLSFKSHFQKTKKLKLMGNGFTLVELLIVIVIIALLSVIGINNFISSQMKSRDSQRKSDLNQIAKSLEMYFNDKGTYPANDSTGLLQVGGNSGCVGGTSLEWNSSFYDSSTTGGAIYMARLPKDPGANNYFYVSVPPQCSGYKIFALLENTHDSAVAKDAEGNPTTYPGTNCGSGECNFVISSPNISL